MSGAPRESSEKGTGPAQFGKPNGVSAAICDASLFWELSD